MRDMAKAFNALICTKNVSNGTIFYLQ